MDSIEKEIIKFRDERDWKQFHNARTLAASIVIESAELLELFQWAKDEEIEEIVEKKLDKIKDEIADIYAYLVILAHDLGINLQDAVREKMKKNARKYPVDKAKGTSKKYTEFVE
ncbi:nucleotide pyrophosphohydrolase [Kosmotoga olearia]|uniref:MazG nucleotide pyrophosphohydrolase n=1 Tax=Kosmotoga olearia (strain ATCC BAA-1733 / DSM 21960 / TBF 19.5.1) TaxID=521045 RepID=C5CG99_KOSOT|nr:nucleotide pyrophosphohydrolase [Kosmotoga olearia]ACR79540.1 MazG nucleotide pyrophosphohydrolase [Kosmotoga olearia TBF 19.5.1]